MAKNAFLKTEYEPSLDYDEGARLLSKASHSKVMKAVIDKAVDNVTDYLSEMLSTYEECIGKYERNARLN